MKNIFLLLSLITVVTINMQAQVPNKFNYQAVARNSQGQSLANANITLRLTILDGGANGNNVYSETRQATTNQLGLFTVGIGGPGATSTTGNFATIDWSTGNKYIKVEADPLGGNNFSVLGNTEMLSVPYALYAVNGKVGPQGPIGLTGPAGPVGATGPQGVPGPAGATGPQGPIGLTGPAGPIGATGPQGVPGTVGATGPQGPIGLTGPAGIQGPIGLTGATGPIGPQGIPGAGTVNGTTNFIGKFTAPDVMGNSIVFDNGTNVGIGISSPDVRLAVDSSIMVDQANSNQGFLDRSSLYFGSDKKVGIVRSFLNGSSGRNGLGFFTNNIRRMTIDSTGQVGVGTINPLQTLHVNGNTYLTGNVGIGSSTPDYAFQNLLGYNHMFYGLGVGTTPNSTYMLDVGSALPSRIRGALTVDGALNVNDNAAIDGSLTVNNGKGVAYNANAATNLRMYRFTTADFHAVLGPHGSAVTAIAFGGGFNSTPFVHVGDIDFTGGVAGELDRVILVLRGCSLDSGTGVTTCIAKIINTDNTAVDYTIRWNCLAIGY